MSTHGETEARKLRGRLSHPIIDADGHWAEFDVIGIDSEHDYDPVWA